MNRLLENCSKPLLLNIGSGERFIGRESLAQKHIKRIVNLDISHHSSVDVVADAHHLPFKRNSFHGIICQAVLEHTSDPKTVMDEMHRVLSEDGILYVEVPFLQGFHPSPTDYYRFTLDGLKRMFSQFHPIDSGVCVGPSSALSWILREYFSGIFTGFSERRIARALSTLFFGWLTFPLKYLDIILAKRPEAHRIASGLFVLAKKSDDREIS
jgi:SAM-dependent methyltransferase